MIFSNWAIIAGLEVARDAGRSVWWLVGPLRNQTEVLSAQNGVLPAARDLLLPKLISGEIDLSGIEEKELAIFDLLTNPEPNRHGRRRSR
jgi:hypothetical protein